MSVDFSFLACKMVMVILHFFFPLNRYLLRVSYVPEPILKTEILILVEALHEKKTDNKQSK